MGEKSDTARSNIAKIAAERNADIRKGGGSESMERSREKVRDAIVRADRRRNER